MSGNTARAYREVEIGSDLFRNLKSGVIKYTLKSDPAGKSPRTALISGVGDNVVNAYNISKGVSRPFKIRIDNLKTFEHATTDAVTEAKKDPPRDRITALEKRVAELEEIVKVLVSVAVVDD